MDNIVQTGWRYFIFCHYAVLFLFIINFSDLRGTCDTVKTLESLADEDSSPDFFRQQGDEFWPIHIFWKKLFKCHLTF